MTTSEMIRNFLKNLYNSLCGKSPFVNILHYQWHSYRIIHHDLKKILPKLEGSILDVGCGEKPYQKFCSNCTKYFGIDIRPIPIADLVVSPDRDWDIEPSTFDNALCFQVLEHAENPVKLISEIHKALKPHGTMVLTSPLCYPEHSVPNDYWRNTTEGLKTLVKDKFDVQTTIKQGGIGSCLAIYTLNWLKKGPLGNSMGLIPFFLFACLFINVLCYFMDFLTDDSSYSNVLILCRKK